jgi:hypothetical protein
MKVSSLTVLDEDEEEDEADELEVAPVLGVELEDGMLGAIWSDSP